MKIAVITKNDLNIKIGNHRIDVFLWSQLSSSVNLRDYDGLVVDLEGLDSAVLEASDFESIIEPEVIKDILVDKENFVVLTGNPFIRFNTERKTTSNLLSHFGYAVDELKGAGDSFDLTRTGQSSIYSRYLSHMKVYENAFASSPKPSKKFLDIYPSVPGKFTTNSQTLARTRSGYALGAVLRNIYHPNNYNEHSIHDGEFVILPSINVARLERIKMIIEANVVDEIEATPDWLDGLKVVGQDEQDEIIQTQSLLLTQTKKTIEDAGISRNILRRVLNLLFYKGKPLEEEVIFALEDMGISVTKPDVENELEFTFNANDKDFVCEVKCVDKEHISKKAMRQVTEWQDIAEEETGKAHKPVVIVSNDLLKPFVERAANPLPDNLKTFSEKYEITVITVSTLLKLHQLYKNEKIDTNKIASKIHSFSGLMGREDFIN